MPQKKLVKCKQSSIHGKGLFAITTIPEGTHIGTFIGDPVKKDGKHVLWYEDEEHGEWKAIKVKNVLKYANHSKEPNTQVCQFDMYALREIQDGEEITFDYGDDWN